MVLLSGSRMVTILDCQVFTSHRRHIDQIYINASGQSEDILSVVSPTSTTSLAKECLSEPNLVPEGLTSSEDLVV